MWILLTFFLFYAPQSYAASGSGNAVVIGNPASGDCLMSGGGILIKDAGVGACGSGGGGAIITSPNATLTVGGTSSATTLDIANLSANQVLGALTATFPSGLSVPSCSAATSALTWTSGVGFGCNTITGGVSSFTGDGMIFNNSASTGAVTATLANQTANTVLGALTATTPSDLALPPCTDTGGNHLNYTSGTGFSCGTSDAHVGTVTSVATTSPITGGTITGTGTIACATCATTTNGGAISGTAPVAVSAGGAISITGAANQVLAGSGPAFTASPTIGTSVTTPLVIGGTAASSTLTLESTSGSGTTDSIVAKTGSQVTSQTWNSNATTTLSKAGIDAQSTPAISTATFTPDFSAGNHFIIGLVHASCPCTLANPTNIVAGQSGVIAIVQSATGSDTITTWGTDYVFTNAASPTLTMTASAIDYLSYYVEDSTHIRANFIPSAPQAVQSGGFISNQTKFTTTGCSISSTTGGAAAGKFTLGANTCTAVITMNGATGLTAANGWSCWAADQTAPTILVEQSASTTTTASLSVPAGAGATDVIAFGCMGY